MTVQFSFQMAITSLEESLENSEYSQNGRQAAQVTVKAQTRSSLLLSTADYYGLQDPGC